MLRAAIDVILTLNPFVLSSQHRTSPSCIDNPTAL